MNLDHTLKQLIDSEFVTSVGDDRYYLTEDGKTIAIGALELYPEIKNIHLSQEPTLEDGIDDWMENQTNEGINS